MRIYISSDVPRIRNGPINSHRFWDANEIFFSFIKSLHWIFQAAPCGWIYFLSPILKRNKGINNLDFRFFNAIRQFCFSRILIKRSILRLLRIFFVLFKPFIRYHMFVKSRFYYIFKAVLKVYANMNRVKAPMIGYCVSERP